MKTVGFGLAGTGLIGKVHAGAIAATTGAQLVAVCGRDQARTQEFAARYGARAFTDYRQMLEQEDIDVVDICTPSGIHADMGIEAAQRGKHVLVEKPIDISVQRADALISACERAERKLGVIFQSRHLPAVHSMKTAISAGKLGELFLGDAYVKWYRAPEYYSQGSWHGTRLLDGGGALINQAIHTVDLLRWMMGPVESVFAFAKALRYPHIESEDTLVASIKFKSGALGVIEATTSVAPGFKRRLEISGEKGTIILDGDEIGVWSLEGESQPEQGAEGQSTDGSQDPAAISDRGHRLHIEDMVRVVTSGGEPMISGREARKSLEICEAAYLSARENRVVNLSELDLSN